MPEPPELLAKSDRAYLVAPAGCGKTQEIAKAVALSKSGRQLVLTHTHAGVDSLRKRLQRLGVSPRKFHVDTIAGWALQYAVSYPALSGQKELNPTGDAWTAVYGAAHTLIQMPLIRRVLQASYSGVYVDEYQDCTLTQHQLIMALAEVLPCRVLGDDLQAIFGFRNDPVVNWSIDVDPNFQRLPDLNTPWRWNLANKELGQWLSQVRNALLEGRPIDVRAGPVTWYSCNAINQRTACLQLAKPKTGSVVAIHQWPASCHNFACGLNGAYTSMEEMECRDLLTASDKIEKASGPARALEIVEFASKCMTQVSAELRTVRGQLQQGRVPKWAQYKKYPGINSALQIVIDDKTLASILPALEAIEQIPSRVIYRRELWTEMKRTLREYAAGTYESLWQAAWATRERTRHTGRRPELRVVSRTLLIKGLEFDHAIVLNADELDAKNLYVAMTRGAQSLTILSAAPVIQKTL
jgi:hypothetical protein